MAEFVEYRQERLLPEYELMKKKQLCSEEEIRKIQKKRANFIYKITKQTPTILDYIAYITYERQLLATLTKRAKTKAEEMTEIQYLIANNIKNLYTEGLKHFPNDLRFWEAYIKFLKFAKFLSEASTAFEKMLMYHGDKPEVWLEAALWEYNENYNIERVKNLFLHGLQKHPENENLHQIFFKIMLQEAAKLNADLVLQDNTESEQTLALTRVIVIYESSKKKINNIEYGCKILKICEKFPFTRKLQKRICSDMMEKFSTSPILWDTLAQRELNGFNMCDLLNKSEDEGDECSSSKIQKKDNSESVTETERNNVTAAQKRKEKEMMEKRQRTVKRRIELCCEVYVNAVNELKNQEMWNYFLNAMLEINQDLSTQKILKRSKLGQAFHAAHNANHMSENHYYTYIELLRESTVTKDETLLEIMRSANIRHPTSLPLWEQHMAFFIRRNKHRRLEQVFTHACASLGDESYPLWKIMLQFYLTRFDLVHKIIPLFDRACQETSEKFTELRLLYLEYIGRIKTFEDVRKLYKELVTYPPPCLELHQKMAFLEAQRLKPDIDQWRKCHDYATHYFGKSSVAVWIDYLRFERDYGNPKNVSLIFERAKEMLDAKYVDHLICEHTLVVTGIQ